MKFSDFNLLSIGSSIQMAGAIFSGEGKTFLCFFPGENEPNNPNTEMTSLDMSKEDWEAFLKQTDLMETEVIAQSKDGTLTKVILRKSSRQIEQSVSWAVFRRDKYACRYCGKDDVPLTIDHLVRWEEGGPSTVANLVSACKNCNKARGNLSYADWLKTPRYRATSTNLSMAVQQANIDILSTLDAIPRKLHVASR